VTARILLVDPDVVLATEIRDQLEDVGYLVDCAGDVDGAMVLVKEARPDLIISAWQLDGEFSGIEFCRRLRLRRDTMLVPIIMLLTRSDDDARIRCLTTGADDALVKPVSLPELKARVGALLRRVNPHILADVLTAHGIELNRATHRVRCAGTELRLGPTEFRLLDTLMGNPGRVFSRARLLDDIWGCDVYVDERTVDVHIARLRKALRTRAPFDPIRTVRGAGYAFTEESALYA
jgi:two-component system phosphate regulon response regulator PhoB